MFNCTNESIVLTKIPCISDDGRVIKAINKGQGDIIETVVIEDIEVFASRQPVINLKVYRNINAQVGREDQEKLIVVSRDEIKSIPLHRCHVQNSCGYVPLRSDRPIL